MAPRPIRVLTFSSLFPNPEQPLHGLFVAERLKHLLATGEVEAEIVAPVPWFPSRRRAFGRYATYARVPAHSTWQGRRVLHPRYIAMPGFGWYLAPLLMSKAAKAAAARLSREGRGFDLIDAHYFYPDGIAAALLGRALDKPVTITARGSDINLIARYALPRQWILWASRNCSAVIAVSNALRGRMVEIGMDPARITVLRNGVDLQRFRPVDRRTVRRRLSIEGRILLSVGNLIELKGHHLAIEAVADLPGYTLLIVGQGPLHGHLSRYAASLGCADRVRLLGAAPQAQLIDFYNAADILVLASSREGMANVLLEAVACGTPVIATSVGGAAEVVRTPQIGRLLRERSGQAIAVAVRELEAHPCDRAVIASYARQLGWEPTVAGILALYRRVLEGRPRKWPNDTATLEPAAPEQL